MTGFEPQMYGVGNDRSTNCATTTLSFPWLSKSPSPYQLRNTLLVVILWLQASQ